MKLSDLEIHIETACNNAYRRVWRPEMARQFIIDKMNEYFYNLNQKIDLQKEIDKFLENDDLEVDKKDEL